MNKYLSMFLVTIVMILSSGKSAIAAQPDADYRALIPADQFAEEAESQAGTLNGLSENRLEGFSLAHGGHGGGFGGGRPHGGGGYPVGPHPVGGYHGPRPYPVPYPRPYPVPYPRPYPVPVPISRVLYCYASDLNGYTYSASGYDTYQTQQNALNQCFAVGAQGCLARGCQY